MRRDVAINELLRSEEPSVRFKVLSSEMARRPAPIDLRHLREQIQTCDRVKTLLSERNAKGEIPRHPYAKWNGAHWVLATLADLNYPAGNEELLPLREQVYRWLFSEKHEATTRQISGRIRRHASQEGNAVYALLALGLADERTEVLIDRLRRWQWPDGGWNCDTRPDASNSSFTESLIPLRAIALHARLTGDPRSELCARRAADLFLRRRLFKRQRDGLIIASDFVSLHFPWYWHYDFLFGLKVMGEIGLLHDERCSDALALLKQKQQPGGHFCAEKRFFQTGSSPQARSLVAWGPQGTKRTNEFVTVEALVVLNQAGETV